MGIRNLNKYLLKNCNQSIQNLHLSELYGKKISVDISIYLYHFERNGNLISGIYRMLNIFNFYNIIPVFIFDGKPPNEKKYILQERKKQKEKNIKKIKELSNSLINISDENIEEKNNILENIEKLKKQTIFMTREKIEQVKNIIRINGFTYYDAPQEADELCSMLVIRGQVWGCMSEDMDMFIYGCPRIIRYFNINNENVKLYNVENILYELKVTFNNFKQICILSGTDYNSRDNKYNLSRSIDLYNQYQKYINLRTYEKPLEFIEWIFKHIDSSLNCELLYKINYMFDLFDGNKLEKFRNILIMNNSQYI